MTLHEVSALRGHQLLEPSEETRNFPAGSILILLEHLTTLEEKGLTRSFVFSPGQIAAGSEITFFVAPSGGREIRPGELALNRFRKEVTSNLLIPAGKNTDADYAYKDQIDESIREYVEEGSLAVPCLIFDDEIQAVIESVFRSTEPRTQDTPAVRLLGLERHLGKPEEVYRRTKRSDRITTVVYLYHDSEFAHLVARSVQLLHERKGVGTRYSNIFTVFRDLVGQFIQRRHVSQMTKGRFRIIEPEAYLHSLGIPITDAEALLIK